MPRDERSHRIDPHDAPGEPGETKTPADTGELAPDHQRALNVFVLGMEAYTFQRLRALDPERRITFHTLVPREALRGVDDLPVRELLEQADDHLARFEEPIDAIVSFLDFPAIEMAAVLSGRYGTKGPTLEQIMRCNHKYWNRLLQQEVSPESIPRFTVVDPFDEDPMARVEETLSYPFWIKPLNAFRSHLGFRIDEPRDFHLALPGIRAGIHRLARPLEYFMELADMPDEIRRMGGHQLLAEEIIGGEEATLEGLVHDGEPRVYGIVDAVRAERKSSFSRHEYPSQVDELVAGRMEELAARHVRHLGLNHGMFNVEIFHDREKDHLWVLEVNSRLSQSHMELFELVDGAGHLKAAVELALGRTPSLPYRNGPYACAAKFFLRSWGDALVTRVPASDEIRAIEEEVAGTSIEMLVEAGTTLSDLYEQDSYSYELAWVWVGAQSRRELVEKYRRVEKLLEVGLEPTDRQEEANG